MTINEIFDTIMSGDSSIITQESILFINTEALKLYEIPVLEQMQITELKKIIMICNVLYNRTDMTVLPIEDGFYDLLLEKYKTYDSNFQVGSAVVQFKNFTENDLDQVNKQAKCPVTFFEKPIKDEYHQTIYDEIMLEGKPRLDYHDFARKMVSFDESYITKRIHNTKHNHPTLVGTLDKCKFVTNQDAIDAEVFDDPNVKILERDFFQDHINKGILDPNRQIGVVCELKYDGISVEADCGLEVISARTRGDTGIGQASDISGILRGYTFKHAGAMIGEEPVGVKFEAIMTKGNLYRFNQLRGRSYANCRSAIVGLFGASDAYLYRDLITLVPLALDLEQFKYPVNNRLEEIAILNKLFTSHGEPLRYVYFEGTYSEILYNIKVFWEEAALAKDDYRIDFMYDGIVVSYLDNDIRQALGRRNFINKYSMAVKFNPLEKQTMFRGYSYEIGQHGDITPMIHYDPVEFNGTIHTKSSGSSLKRFQDLNLKYGDFINVTYRNDVMPYVSRIECDHNRNNPNPVVEIIHTCPACGSELQISDSGRKLYCPNNECPARSTQRMVNMFSKMNIKGFAMATFNSISDLDHLYKLYRENGTIDKQFYINKLGVADGENFYNSLVDLVSSPQKDYIIMGALGFTSIAHKKWQSILQQIKLVDLCQVYNQSRDTIEFYNRVSQISNIGEVTARTIATEWEFFKKDIDFIVSFIPLENSYGVSSDRLEIRFSGYRNLQLSQQLCNEGYDADGNAGVTKNTDILIIPYEGFTSTKVTKALKNPHTKIVPIEDFLLNIKLYLGEDINI